MRIHAFAKIMRLKQACSHHRLLYKKTASVEQLDMIERNKLFAFVDNENTNFKLNLVENIVNELNDSNCAICQYEYDSDTVILKCGHLFCQDCIDRMFMMSEPVCPSCKKDFKNVSDLNRY
mmetsp:Transcript_55078/g.120077  ORF Transcript_55078/g.120077 Transcript_55078/m.120077 type:complete len:121 (+) Transcript_55078:1355-1717(+)